MVGLKRPVDAKEIFETVQRLQNRYLEIKKAIAAANAGISAQLTEMLVVRAEKEYYEKLDCRESSPRGDWEIANDGSRVWRTEQFDAYINEGKRQEIVEALADRYGIQMDREQLITEAEAFAIRASGRSPRTARQFIDTVNIRTHLQ